MKPEQQAALCAAVREAGVGIAGCHGGMCDAFRNSCEYQFMTGGQWVAHPGNDGVKYTVRMKDHRSPDHQRHQGFRSRVRAILHARRSGPESAGRHEIPHARRGWPAHPNGEISMPVLWTKMYGKGRVFYSSLGHTADLVASEPHLTIMRRGFKWAAEGKGK